MRIRQVPIESSDIYCIAVDWINSHKQDCKKQDWLEKAVTDIKRVYSTVDWSAGAVRLLKYELECYQPWQR